MTESDISTDSIPLDAWASTADDLLSQLTGPHVHKKRRTLLKLAEATYLNVAQSQVFRRSDCASKVAHYKWRSVDHAYDEAYRFLVGDDSQPGLARVAREQELDADERQALSALQEARTRLRVATAPAVAVLEEALLAKDKVGPDWRSRISAANSILDRADRETAAQSTLSVTTVEEAIHRIYGNDQADQPQLPRGPDDHATSKPVDSSVTHHHDGYHDSHTPPSNSQLLADANQLSSPGDQTTKPTHDADAILSRHSDNPNVITSDVVEEEENTSWPADKADPNTASNKSKKWFNRRKEERQ